MLRAGRVLWAVCALMATLGAVAWGQGRAAMISDLKGKVEFRAPGAPWKTATIMTFLPAGAEVRAAGGATATLAFIAGGARAHLSGPCVVQVTGRAAKLVSGAGSALRTTSPDRRAGALLPQEVNFQQMGGARLRQLDLLALDLDEASADIRPTIRWTAQAKFVKFDVTVTEEEEPYREVFKTTCPGSATSVTLPADHALAYGHRYEVLLVGYATARLKAPERVVEVLAKEDADRLQAARREADEQFAAHPDDVTPLVLMVSMYAQHQLYSAAVDMAEKVIARRNEDATLYLYLSRLYEARQDATRAAEARRRYEELSKRG